MALHEHSVAGTAKGLSAVFATPQTFTDGADINMVRLAHGFSLGLRDTSGCWHGNRSKLGHPAGNSASSTIRTGNPSLIGKRSLHCWQTRWFSSSESGVERLGSQGQRSI